MGGTPKQENFADDPSADRTDRHGSQNMPSVDLWLGTKAADGQTTQQHNFKTYAELDAFNKQYNQSLQDRNKEIDLLSTNQGRDATMLAGPSKGLL